MNRQNADNQEIYASISKTIDRTRFRILHIWRFNEKSDIWNFIPHRHDCYELLFFLHGNAQITSHGQSFYAGFSDLIVYPPGTLHTEHLQTDHKQEIYCLQVQAPGLSIDHILQIPDRKQQIKHLLDGLFNEFEAEGADPLVMNSYLQTLARVLARNHLCDTAPIHPVERCMMYMRHNMAQDIKIEQLAELLHISKSYLNRIFLEYTGVTPITYLMDIRVDAAKTLLMTSNRHVSEIAELVGFHSPKYFCHQFHRNTGLSPREFRRREGLNEFQQEARREA